MTARQFLAAITKLGWGTAYAAAPKLGISRQQAYKIAAGISPVTPTIEKLLKAYERLGGDAEL